jgi:hypothetical protein
LHYPYEEDRLEEIVKLGTAFESGYVLGKSGPKKGTDVYNEGQTSQIIHNVPRIAIEIDGKSVAPESIKRFDGQPLHYVVDKETLDKKVLHVFTTNESVLQYYIKSQEGLKKMKEMT